jgi:hypothetical protein
MGKRTRSWRNRQDLPPAPLPSNPSFDDLTGKMFRVYAVLHYGGFSSGKHWWAVRCACGRIKLMPTWEIVYGQTTTCGDKGCCKNAVDLDGETIGQWKVLRREGSDKFGRATWRCLCLRCNVEAVVPGIFVRDGRGGRMCKTDSCRSTHWRFINPDGTMNCLGCDRALPFDDEHFRKNNKFACGRSRQCLDCSRAVLRRQQQKRRLRVLDHYSHGKAKCACPNCPEHTNPHIEFLSIDHIGGGGSAHRRAMKRQDIYSWLIKHKYPDGFRVLCHNCNWAVGAYGRCPHDNESRG